jgi:hypothetical protein
MRTQEKQHRGATQAKRQLDVLTHIAVYKALHEQALQWPQQQRHKRQESKQAKIDPG